MTLEYAAQLVSCLRAAGKSKEAAELFSHFYDFFNLDDRQGEIFASICGYGIATDVSL